MHGVAEAAPATLTSDHADAPLLAEALERHGPFWAAPSLAAESGHWNALAEENAIHAAISTFDERKEEKKSREAVEFLMNHVEAGARVLDLGCGYGRLAKYLLPLRKLEAYVGVDCSPVMLKKFHERYAATEAERGTPLVLVRGDIDRIPLQDASVDMVIVSAVYLHNHKDITRASLAEVRRVLRPGGKLIILSSFPNGRGLTGLQGRAYLAYLGLVGQGTKNGPVRYFDRAEVERLLAGFSDVEIHPTGFTVLPKTFLGLPAPLRRPYRLVYDRIHAFLRGRLSQDAQARHCAHFDVVARA